MSMNISFYIVAGIRVNRSGGQLQEEIDHQEYIGAFYDDETFDNPVVGHKLVDFDNLSDSSIEEMPNPDGSVVIAARLRALGFEARPEDIKLYVCALWG